ncbi:phage tail protein [Rudanella paleaurantiibacter]|uniref:Phage tail protein n=1 Tax=Rudanella paleaurantiibacter TaxID=2614655 RepID=A0A7J5TZ34_9BACT|nr:tail fiber protein [Rudanella paleaurantiibacter]KAB7730394.1 phage tail protein [Rudanella paleaurantiibacter]
MDITSFVAEIGITASNFAPTGWALCNGQILPISQNTALFSLLGTFYGGDGKSTFALPDLQGRVPIHQGQGPGLSQFFIGQEGGAQVETLIPAQITPHGHSAADAVSLTQLATTDLGNSASPAGRAPAQTGTDNRYAATSNGSMAPYTLQVGYAGGINAPFSIMQPSLTLTFCIALQGVFPPRG